jgi:hypothetical protein
LKKLPLLFFLLSGLAGAAFPVDLMDRSSGLAGLACGGAGTARTDQISAPYWNPAGLAYATKSGVEFTYYQNLGLVNHISLDGVLLLGGKFPLGLNYVQEGINNIPRTSEGDGGLPAEQGTFSDEYRFFNIATATQLSPGIYGGLNYKFISRSILDYHASGMAVDIGIIQRATRELQLGLNFHNLFSSLEWSTATQEYLPRKLTAGLAYRQNLLQKRTYFLVDLDIYSEEERGWGVGLESWLIDNVFCLRGGLNSQEELSLGSGFKYYDFHCDLALLLRTPEKQLDNSFLFSLGFDFSLDRIEKSAPDKTPANFQPQFRLEASKLIISNLKPEQLLEIALLDPDYNVIQLPLAETVTAPVASGNYTLFFQLRDNKIIRKTFTVK